MASKKTIYLFKIVVDYLGGFALAMLSIPLIIVLCVIITIRYGCFPIYSQTRIGRHGKPFRIYKLKTLYNETSPSQDRFTRFLRKTNMDELPQLFNVLMGSMSLVGPRPHLEDHVKQYEPWQRERLLVKPGITGLRQIAKPGKLEFNELVELDIAYINNRNLGADIHILIKTICIQFQKF